jgi:hypothetical protein
MFLTPKQIAPALGLSSPTVDQNNLLTLYVGMVEDLARQMTNRDWAVEPTQQTDILSGNGLPEIGLTKFPVLLSFGTENQIRVWLNDKAASGQASDPWPDDKELTIGDEFALRVDGDGVSRSGLIYKVSGVWPSSRTMWPWPYPTYPVPVAGNIKATYIWQTCDAEIGVMRMAVMAGVCWLAKNMSYGLQGITSERLGEASYTLAALAVPGVRGILLPLLGSVSKPAFQ